MSIEEHGRRCSRCKDHKPRAAFARNKAMRDGPQAYCRECAAVCHQERQAAKGPDVRPRVEVPEGHKLCRTCGEIKPHRAWTTNRTASDGLATLCTSCKAAQGRAGHLKRQYGITAAERDALIASQGGICCICLAAPAAHVDHCHETGRVRGVLCFSRNAALGQFKDRPDAIRRAAAYVEGIAWKPTLVAPGVYQLPS
ncbi:endonuclease VII domain-containing protein [Streptomyces sp. MH60]|uniref:endonuclease VII domain-containing protein n=1 Tax=Streptomyces sp. MH60 TaxID=1940758 RepID=UPI000CED96CB|nr:endonuclease VII domain-containing protein [Streptomyces sp. MH60]